jgi:hypothetical protein
VVEYLFEAAHAHVHIGFLILVLAKREEDDIALVDPHLLPQFATDMCQSDGSVKALCLKAAVAQHLDDLCILLTVLLKHQLALLVVVLILSTSPILTLRSRQ